jgi:hypothetical protein
MVLKGQRENRFGIGTIVYALEYPLVKLIVRRYVSRIDYCTVTSDPSQGDRVYFERELVGEKSNK